MLVARRQISARGNIPPSVYIAVRSAARVARSIRSSTLMKMRKSARERGSMENKSRERGLGAVAVVAFAPLREEANRLGVLVCSMGGCFFTDER